MQQKAKTPAKVVQMRPRTKPAGMALDPRQAKALHQQDTAHRGGIAANVSGTPVMSQTASSSTSALSRWR